MIFPTIVVATYNRLDSLKRLLETIVNANYEGCNNVRLLISVDKHSTEEEKVLNFLNNFDWPFGEYIIKTYKKRLGLKNHFIQCCDYTYDYDSIIFLEDDFIVSKNFYKYSTQSLNFYKDDTRISGIALYSLAYNEFSNRVFTPLEDGSEQYFIQIPTWGKVFNKEKWRGFKEWYLSKSHFDFDELQLPKVVRKWSKKSFKREYIKYLVDQNKYFVLPRKSFVTNFGEPGEHFFNKESKFQRPLRIEYSKSPSYSFVDIATSLSVYDVYMEILPDKLKRINSDLQNYNFTVDLYGIKPLNQISTEYILTYKKVAKPILRFGRDAIPHEANIIFKFEGDDFYLALKKEVKKRKKGIKTYFDDCMYDDRGLSVMKLVLIDVWKFVNEIKLFFKKDTFNKKLN
jgi:hypothetical protein